MAFVLFHNTKYHTSLRIEDFRDYRLHSVYPCTPEVERERLVEFYESHYFTSILPVKGAQEGVRRLARYNPDVLTSRDEMVCLAGTDLWVDSHFPAEFGKTVFANHFTERHESKVSLCIQHKYRLLIDDNIKYVQECAQAGIPAVLLDKPWNQGAIPDLVLRVSGWPDVPRAVDSLLRP